MAHQTRNLPNRQYILVLAALFCLLGNVATAATIELAGPAGAEVFVDGEAIGFLPFTGPLELLTGKYILRCELMGHQPFEKTIHLVSDQDRKIILTRLMPLRKRTAFSVNLLFAGLGQHYTGQNLRGWVYNALEAGGLLFALSGELQRSNYRKDYLLLMENYHKQINGEEIEKYRQEVMIAYSDMEDMEKQRDSGLMIAGGAVILSILDSILFFPSVEAGMGYPVKLGSSVESPLDAPTSSGSTLHVAFKTTF